MFAYLLIVAELSILVAVFWYVFVREPKPLEIKENLWGYYNQPVDASTGYGINSKGSLPQNQTDKPRKSRKLRRVVYTGHVLLRSARHGIKRKETRSNDLRKGWVQSTEESKSASILSCVLAFLGDKLTQLSVKLS